MNNLEQLESHHRMYSWLEEQIEKNYTFDDEDDSDWQVLENRYPELLTFVESLISHVKSLVNREQELLTKIASLELRLEENLKKKIQPPSDRECLQSYLCWDEEDVELFKYIDEQSEANCWVEYPTVEE